MTVQRLQCRLVRIIISLCLLKRRLQLLTLSFCIKDQRSKQFLRKAAFPLDGFHDLGFQSLQLCGGFRIIGFHAAKQRLLLLHLFAVTNAHHFAFGSSLHPLKNLPHHFINDTVKNMRRVAGLPITLGLLAGLAIADIPHPLYNARGVILARVRLSVCREGEPGPAMPTEHISSQQVLPQCVHRHAMLLFNRTHTVLADALCSFKQLRFYDLQVRQQLGTAFSAAKHAGIGQVAKDTPNCGMMPHFTRSRPIAEVI